MGRSAIAIATIYCLLVSVAAVNWKDFLNVTEMQGSDRHEFMNNLIRVSENMTDNSNSGGESTGEANGLNNTGIENGQNNMGRYNGNNNEGDYNGNNNIGNYNGNNNGGSGNGNGNFGGFNGNWNGNSHGADNFGGSDENDDNIEDSVQENLPGKGSSKDFFDEQLNKLGFGQDADTESAAPMLTLARLSLLIVIAMRIL
ncbi:serum response factor homolog B-like [Watersipora subatra]|uniref:serum response factor homolog B-like n=1 Tax=Watersipora subatra TaxID=2589382 RepID=UPI00355B6238